MTDKQIIREAISRWVKRHADCLQPSERFSYIKGDYVVLKNIDHILDYFKLGKWAQVK